MSTSISKNINHPPSGFNPHAPDPASECIVIRGRSISAQSYSPAKNLKMGKPHWWSAFLGTQRTLSWCFFIVFFPSLKKKKKKKCEFQRVWRGKKETAQVTGPLSLGLTLSSGELALSFLYFPKGLHQATWLTSACQRHPGASLPSIYKWNGKPKQPVFCLWSPFFWFVLC